MESAILAREGDWAVAIVAGEPAALLALMDEACTVAHGSGLIEPRDAFIANLEGRIQILSSRLVDPTVVVVGDMAMVTAEQEQEIRLQAQGGDAQLTRANATKIWVRIDDSWKLRRLHFTRLT